MDNKILISIIIPLYNAEKYIRETIESIIHQKQIGYEVIIVNDGSSDCSPEICKEFLNDHITLINQVNSGAPAARNNGFRKAKGKYILFLDADDSLCEGCFEKVVSVLEDNSYSCVIGNFIRSDGEENSVDLAYGFADKDLNHLYMIPPYPCNKFYLRQYLIDNKLEFSSLKITQDLNFFYKFIGKVTFKNVGFVNCNICKYRFVNNSISHSADSRILDICKSIDDCENYYKNNAVETYRTDLMHLSSLRHICYQMFKCHLFANREDCISSFETLKEYWKKTRKNTPIHINAFYMRRLFKADLLYIYTITKESYNIKKRDWL